MTPHKHAALIKAWADDTSITLQCRAPRAGRLDTQWATINNPEGPTWNEGLEYRIKPKKIKYRNYLWRCGASRAFHVSTVYIDSAINNGLFIKWLGDWQEVEV